MKKIYLLLLALSLSLYGVSQLIEKTFYFENPKIEEIGEYQLIRFENTQQLAKPGNPLIPYMDVRLLLPPGKSARQIEVIGKNAIKIPEKLNLYPKQYARPVSEGKSGNFIKNVNVYSSNKNYPEKLAGNLSTHYLNGHSFALSSFTPIKYNPANGKASFYKEITVRIYLKDDKKAEKALHFLNSSGTIRENVRNFSQNPNTLNLYPKSKTSNNYHILLITSEEYANSFSSLNELNQTKGMITSIITIEAIEDEYIGIDVPEKIRNCIINEYQNHGIEHVILGGDVEIVPYRGFFCSVQSSSVYEDDNIPSDLYYSALDGTWNDDNDNLWGEIGEDDLLPDISVARIPFSNTGDLNNLLTKSISYQTNPVTGELDKSILAGEHLWNDPLTWGGDYLDLLIGHHEDNDYTTDGIPIDAGYYKLYDRDLGSWSASTLISKINEGYPFIHHVGHANDTYNMRLYISDINNSTFSSLDGTIHNYTLVYSHGCISGSFDYNDCIGEKMVNIEKFAVSFIGNSRYGWFNEGQTEGPSQHLHREFIDALYDQKESQIGTTQLLSKLNTAPWVNADDQHEEGALRWCFYDCNVLGDPTMNIWTDEALDLTVNYDNTLEIGTESINIGITTGSEPMENINCTFIKDSIVYGIAHTDASGMATLTVDQSLSTLGEAELFISGYNCIPTSYPVNIIATDEPYIILESYDIFDWGNNLPDYGETVELNFVLKNIGLDTAQNITVSLSSEDEFVLFTDNVQEILYIIPDGSYGITTAFGLLFSDSVPDQHTSQIDLNITAEDTFEWIAPMYFTINAPELTIGNIYIDDSEGNDNGIIDAGENLEMSFVINNIGHAVSPIIEANLTGSNNIEISEPNLELDSCLAGNAVIATYNVTIDEDANLGSIINLQLLVSAGDYAAEKSFVQTVGILMEGFESGDLTGFDWINEGDAGWFVSNEHYEGNYALKSGNINDEQYSSLSLVANVFTNGEISFWKKVSSEPEYDYLRFYIDNVLQEEWSGTVDWSLSTINVNAGIHTFSWKYEKDYFVSYGLDCAWLDNIIFPPMTNPNEPVFSINLDSINCSMETDIIDTVIMRLANTGGGDLLYSISFDPEQDWISLSNNQGSINAGDHTNINIYINSGGLPGGTYECNMVIEEVGTTTIPVKLSVLPTGIATVNSAFNDFIVYPNPVTENSIISFNISTNEKVSVFLYDIHGKLIRRIFQGQLNTGNHILKLNEKLNNGIYIIELQYADRKINKKIIIAD